MTREERLKWLAKRLWLNSRRNKAIDTKRGEYKDKFFELLEDGIEDHRLRVQTIEVPDEFFSKTGLSRGEFASSRFPGWQIEHCERNILTGQTVFVFKQDPRYVGDVIELPDGDHVIRVQKEIAESTPEVDWDTLQAERPDLYDALAKEVKRVELDVDAFERLIASKPDDLAVLQRHLLVKPPVRKVVARRVKNAE